MYRVTRTYFLLPDLATSGFPLDNPPPAEYEIDLLKIPGVFDFVTLCLVFCMRMPMMGAEARTDFIHVEKEFFRGNDFSYLPRFLAQAAYILWLNLIRPDDFWLRH